MSFTPIVPALTQGGTINGTLTIQGGNLNVAGGINATLGNVDVTLAGQGLRVAEGANAKQGVATLVAGTVTVANTGVTANSRIITSVQAPGGTQGILSVTRSVGVSFTIASTNVADTSTVAWEIFEPG